MWMGPGRVLLREADTQRRQWEDSANTAVTWPQAWNTSGHQELEEAESTLSPLEPSRGCSPADTGISDIRLRSWERISVCVKRRPVCGYRYSSHGKLTEYSLTHS